MSDNQIRIMPTDVMNDEMKNMYLNFNIGGELYGIEVRYVLQIIGMQEITVLPEMPPFMKGFIRMRGSVIPVVSVRLRFGKEEEPYTDRTCIIVVQVGEKEIGLIVDSIQETITIEPENIMAPPSTDGNSHSFVSGIARLSENSTSTLVNANMLFD